MRIVIRLADDDLFVMGEYVSIHGAHQKRLTEGMPPEIHDAALAVAEWAGEQEPLLRGEIENRMDLDEARRMLDHWTAVVGTLANR